MSGGVLAGYLMWLLIIAFVLAIVVGPPVWRRHRAATLFGRRARFRAKPVLTYRESTAYQADEPTHSMLPEAWTPAEREAFGINDLEQWIRETDRQLADPLERRMMATEEEIKASLSIPTPILTQGGWARRVEEEETFRRVAPGVWEQK